jgi:branched-chain amino acid transport system permease protein
LKNWKEIMETSFVTLAMTAFHGLVYAMLLCLVASGLTLVFGMMGVLNLAHASFYMLGAYVGHTVLLYTGSFWFALLTAPILTGLFGLLVERYLLRALHPFGHIYELLLTIGLQLLILEGIKWLWGTEPLAVQTPRMLEGSIKLLGAPYPIYRLFVLLFSVLILAALGWGLIKTRLGMVIRAAVDNADMVSALGINTPLVFAGVFAAGTALAAIAGVIAGPLLGISPGMADVVGFDVFVVVVTGGLGSFLGAAVASLLIGELQAFGVIFYPRISLVLMFLIMAVVLSIRPQGLFGVRE